MSRPISSSRLVDARRVPDPAAAVDRPAKGLSSVNVPVVSRADYAIDLSRPTAGFAAEAVRLDGWFRSMDLGYGDTVYIDGSIGRSRATMSPGCRPIWHARLAPARRSPPERCRRAWSA